MSNFNRLATGAIAATAIVGGIATWSTPRVASAQGGPPALPEEVFAACQSKSEGDACALHIGEHVIEGVCSVFPNEKRLFCRPNAAPPRGRDDVGPTHLPPPRAREGSRRAELRDQAFSHTPSMQRASEQLGRFEVELGLDPLSPP